MEPTVLAVDPGSAKCGVAVVHQDGRTLLRDIVATERIQETLAGLVARFRPVALIVGGGTSSRLLLRELQSGDLPLPVERVEEAHTTEAARQRYLAEHPARGWERLLPRGLRTPPRPVDDYAAVILAERYWQTHPRSENAS